MTASRSSVSFTEENWQRLRREANKSAVVNEALNFFYRSKKFLKEKEEEFILRELAHYRKTGEGYSVEEVFGDVLDEYNSLKKGKKVREKGRKAA